MDGHLLIQNATLILPDRVVEGDLRVSGGSISTIAPGGGLDVGSNEAVIDATGLHLLPGAIDPHVHFREPGSCLLYTSPSPRDKRQSRMPSSA